VAQIAAIVAGKFDRFILTHAHKAGADPATFAAAFAGKDMIVAPDTAAAARLARQRAEAEGLTVLAIGGMFLAVEVQHAWTGGDPATLDFF
jgi:L-ascorbate metabolism protein UlaG (beta-lactamase superfamily)